MHLGKKSDSELSRLNEVVCVTRPVGGVRSHENCWVGCRSRSRAGVPVPVIEGAAHLCFRRLAKRPCQTKPWPELISGNTRLS